MNIYTAMPFFASLLVSLIGLMLCEGGATATGISFGLMGICAALTGLAGVLSSHLADITAAMKSKSTESQIQDG